MAKGLKSALLVDDDDEDGAAEAAPSVKAETNFETRFVDKVDVVEAIPQRSSVRASGAAAYVERIEVEAVVGGVLQKITVTGVSPEKTGDFLRGLDPACKVRDAFPMKAMGGNRETKSAAVAVIVLDVRESGKFWSFIATRPDGEEVNVKVGKAKSDAVLEQLRALGRLSDGHFAKLEGAIDTKKSATVILEDASRFGVKYWTGDDGSAFADGFDAAPPAAGGKE